MGYRFISGIMVLCKASDKYLELLHDELHPVQNEQDDEQDINLRKTDYFLKEKTKDEA